METFINQIISKDQQFFIFLNNLGTPTWDSFWLFITDKWTAIPIYALLLFLLYKKFNLRIFLLTLICVGIGVTLTDQLSNLFKNEIFLRLRPCHDPMIAPYVRLVKASCGGQYGYFSAHAGNSFMLATFLSLVLKDKIKYISFFLVLWASLVAYSRIYIGVHYPLDVLTGVFLGSIIGFSLFELWRCLSKKFN